MEVHRSLPQRALPMVGAWCFLDRFGPQTARMRVEPHPHIGLQTVTWLVEGEILHRDSLGVEQLVRPGQLNLMTAGRGVAHAEEGTDGSAGRPKHGIQLWVAQPEATRHGEPDFEHHADLPRVELDNGEASVLVGAFAEVTSPARADTDHVGVDLALRVGHTVVPLRAGHEHALVVLDGAVELAGEVIVPGALAYLGTGRDELALSVAAAARVVLLGGTPFESAILMWWNFVARTRDEVAVARTAWQDDDRERFPEVASRLDRIDAPGLPWS